MIRKPEVRQARTLVGGQTRLTRAPAANDGTRGIGVRNIRGAVRVEVDGAGSGRAAASNGDLHRDVEAIHE